MKQFLSVSTLLLASLAAAAPLSARASSVTISIKTGDGDSATTLTVPLDLLTQTSGLSTKEVAASISTPNTFCQAFSDTQGTTPLGPVFSLGNDASFSASSSGGTASQASDAVTVGAFLCSASQAGVAPKTNTNTNSGTTTSTNTGTTSLKPSPGKVTVQLEQVSDQFVQTDIPLDNSLVATTSTRLGNMGIDLSLVLVSGSTATLAQVGCQVFEDAQGTVPVGGLATSTTDAVLAANPVAPSHIQSIRCGAVG